MLNYELMIEYINPCGGEKHAVKEFQEIDVVSPEAYVAEHGQYPVLDAGVTPDGDIVITTGDGKGSMVRYTFME